MKYIYDIIVEGSRKETTTKWEEAREYFNQFIGHPKQILVHDGNKLHRLFNDEDVEDWQVKLERENVWKPVKWADKAIEISREYPFSPIMSLETAIESIQKLRPQVVEKVKDHINPSHYQGYFGGIDDIIPELQWLETKQYQNHWKDPEKFKAAVLLQADKYLSRLGGKDEAVQEIKKGIWYLRFLAAYIANDCKPIRVVDIPRLLGE